MENMTHPDASNFPPAYGVPKEAVAARRQLQDNADLATAVVRRAGSLAARMRATGVETQFKTSISDVVTEADHSAERQVFETLASLRPDDGILGEEGTNKPSESGYTWVIDPVDGTYNFTSGSDYWCSAVALVKGDTRDLSDLKVLNDPARVVLGAVHRPATGETWIGGPELGTTRIDNEGNAEELRIEGVEGPSALSQISVGTYLHSTVFGQASGADSDPEDTADIAAWSRAVSASATWRVKGSASIDLASVAGGQFGAWFQRDVKPWDWLPGYALVLGAGGAGDLVGRWRVAGSAQAVAELAEILGGSEGNS